MVRVVLGRMCMGLLDFGSLLLMKFEGRRAWGAGWVCFVWGKLSSKHPFSLFFILPSFKNFQRKEKKSLFLVLPLSLLFLRFSAEVASSVPLPKIEGISRWGGGEKASA